MAEGSGDWTYDAQFPEYQLTRYDRDTGTRATLTSRYGSGFRPAVSPDGQTLVYGSRHEDATGLRVRDLASGDERWLMYPIQRDDMESRATLDILPGYDFTPDGQELVAFAALGKLYVMDAEGETPRVLAADVDGGLSHPIWSPDGQTIAVISWREPEAATSGRSQQVWEMWMLGSGGMSNHDVLRSATIFGANGIGLENELGSIEPGKLADLVIFSQNPLDDLRNTTSIRQVMVNGRLFDAETLDEQWPRERALPYRGFVTDEPSRAGGGR